MHMVSPFIHKRKRSLMAVAKSLTGHTFDIQLPCHYFRLPSLQFMWTNMRTCTYIWRVHCPHEMTVFPSQPVWRNRHHKLIDPTTTLTRITVCRSEFDIVIDSNAMYVDRIWVAYRIFRSHATNIFFSATTHRRFSFLLPMRPQLIVLHLVLQIS